MRWSDLDVRNRTLSIARFVYETEDGGWAEKETKTHQVLTIGLEDVALAVFARHRAQVDARASELHITVPGNAFLFSRSPAGSEPFRPDVVSKLTNKAAKTADVDTHLHALRHFSATQAIVAALTQSPRPVGWDTATPR